MVRVTSFYIYSNQDDLDVSGRVITMIFFHEILPYSPYIGCDFETQPYSYPQCVRISMYLDLIQSIGNYLELRRVTH
jgi:hypothetical protein